MKRVLLILTLGVIALNSMAITPNQSHNTYMAARSFKNLDDNQLRNHARGTLMAGDLNQSVELYCEAVNRQQQKRLQGRQVSEELLGEYAYALALAQIQEEALKTIDLAINISSLKPVPEFYIYSVLYLTGYKEIADVLADADIDRWCKKAPKWLNGKGCEINEKYAAQSAISINDKTNGIKTIRNLISNNRKIEALAYSTSFMEQYPEDQLGYLLASSAWENVKCYTQAYATFEKGYALSEKEYKSLTKEAMTSQYEYLQKQSRKYGNKKSFSIPILTYIYGGIGYGNKSFTVQARYGVSQGPFSASFDASYSIPNKGKSSYSVGVTGYYRWWKMMTGLGLALYDKSFAITPSIGMSFLNSSGTSSLDLMLTSYFPIGGSASCGLTFTIGKTFYFKL